MVLALAGLAATVGSSLLGAKAANDTNKANEAISLRNFYAEQEARKEQQRIAEQQKQEAWAGRTDAYGNRTHYVEGQGWVTDLSPEQQMIANAAEAEQLRKMQMGRRDDRVQDRASFQRENEAINAQAADVDYRNARLGDEGSLRQLLIARGAQERNDSADRAGEMVARDANRRGGTNAAQLMQGARASADAEGSRQAGVDASLEAKNFIRDRFIKDREATAGQYDFWRDKSTSGTGDTPIFSTAAPPPMSTGVADQSQFNAYGRSASQDYQAPNYALATGLNDIGAAYGAYQDRQDSKERNQAMLDAFGKIGSFGNTGSFGGSALPTPDPLTQGGLY